jgi:hypothetical protein
MYVQIFPTTIFSFVYFSSKKTLERETMKSSAVFREKLGEIGGKVKDV